MKVLVAIDESKYSEKAIEALAERPWWGDTSILVLHVIALPEPSSWQDWGLKVSEELKERLRAQAQKLIAEKVAALKKQLGDSSSIEGKIVEGHTCDCIVEVAEEWGADLIVVGSHGRTGLQKFLLGSVAEGVLLQARCSVEIIKTAHQADQKLPPKKKDQAVAATGPK